MKHTSELVRGLDAHLTGVCNFNENGARACARPRIYSAGGRGVNTVFSGVFLRCF